MDGQRADQSVVGSAIVVTELFLGILEEVGEERN
jgi:hypothetical protein